MAATIICTKSAPPPGPRLSGKSWTRSWRTMPGSSSSSALVRSVRSLIASIAPRTVSSTLMDGSRLSGVGQVRRGESFECHADSHAIGEPAADPLAEDERDVAVGELGPRGHPLRQFLGAGEDVVL